jgi:excisionase family DNA binding protein
MATIERAAVSVEAAAVLLSVSRSFAWRMVNDGTIRTVRAGKRVLVPVSAINDFLGDGGDGKK